MTGYFSFHKLIARTVLKIVYFLGFLVLTAGGTALIVWAGLRLNDATIARQLGWRYVAIGAAALIVGNLAWRVICEFWIVLFNIHELLNPIDYSVSPIRNLQNKPVQKLVFPSERRTVVRETSSTVADKPQFTEREKFGAHRSASSVLGLS